MPESTATRATHRRLSLGYETVNNESATRESSFPFAITMETRATKSSIVSGIDGYRSHEVDTESSSRGYTESRSEVNQRSSLRRETKTRSCKELNGGSLGTRILHYIGAAANMIRDGGSGKLISELSLFCPTLIKIIVGGGSVKESS